MKRSGAVLAKALPMNWRWEIVAGFLNREENITGGTQRIMNKSRRTCIRKYMQAYNVCRESLDVLSEKQEELDEQMAKLLRNLYKDRPKEYIRDAIECFQEAKRDGLDEKWPYIDELLMEAQDWLNEYDSFIDERIERSTPAQRKKLLGTKG